MKAAKLIIVSGGFAGITLADHLNRRFARDVEVVVISSENHMVFTPMLAEVAGRSLSGLDVVLPGRQIAPRPTWLTATVTGVDLEKNELEYTHPDRKSKAKWPRAPGRDASKAAFGTVHICWLVALSTRCPAAIDEHRVTCN